MPADVRLSYATRSLSQTLTRPPSSQLKDVSMQHKYDENAAASNEIQELPREGSDTLGGGAVDAKVVPSQEANDDRTDRENPTFIYVY